MKKEFEGCNVIGSVIIIGFMLLAVLAGVAWLSIDLNLALLSAIAVAIAVLALQGAKWDFFEKAIESTGKTATMPAMIILCVGAVVAAWMASGTIPTIIYWGLKLINPNLFVTSAFILCAIVSIMTGSSLSSIGTVGIALIVMSNVLDVSLALTSGAIVSGAYLGDKMSPLSDTTNLAPAVTQADLFDHIRSMMYSAIPVVVVCLILYTILGFGANGASLDSAQNDTGIIAVLDALEGSFNLGFTTLIPAVVMLVLALKRVPALPSMFISIFAATLVAVFIQGETFDNMFSMLYGGYNPDTGNEMLDSLLNRGGLSSMFWTFAVTYSALMIGEIMQRGGVFTVLVKKLDKATSSVAGLTSVTVGSCVAVNALTGDQYMAILLPGKLWLDKFKEKKLLPQVFSRILESAGTVTAPLVPWNIAGVNCTRLLGVSTYAYAPYFFLGILFPIVEIVFALLGKFMWTTGEIKSKKVYEDLAEVK